MLRELAPDPAAVEVFRGEVNAAASAITTSDRKIDSALASSENQSSLWGWVFNTQRYQRYSQLTDARTRTFGYAQTLESLKTVSQVMVETSAVVAKSPLCDPTRTLTGADLFSPRGSSRQ